MSAAVDVVVPVYGNGSTVAELHRRLAAVLPGSLARLIFVDDASPDDAADALATLVEADRRVEVVTHRANAGQHRAVLSGLGRSRAPWVVVMDADLQDPPEAIPALLETAADGFDVVFAGRRGNYESRGRLRTSRLFKRVLSRATGLPSDAGMFAALNREAVERLLRMRGPEPFVVAMIGRAGLRTTSIPVERSPRGSGRSAYDRRARLRAAASGLRWTAWSRSPLSTSARMRRHNQAQRAYFAATVKRNMLPRRSRYLERQVDEMLAFAGLRPGDRVLDVGCGMGRYTLPLADRGLRVEGMDLSPQLLDHLRPVAEARGIGLHLGDVIDPPAELRGRYDAAIGFFVLHHLHDVAGCLRSIGTLVRPGGVIAFLEPNPFNPLYYVQMAVRPSMTWEGDGGLVRMRRGPLTRAVAGAGVAAPWFERFGFFPPQIADLRGAEALERRIERLRALAPFLPFHLVGGRVAAAQDGASTPSGPSVAFDSAAASA